MNKIYPLKTFWKSNSIVTYVIVITLLGAKFFITTWFCNNDDNKIHNQKTIRNSVNFFIQCMLVIKIEIERTNFYAWTNNQVSFMPTCMIKQAIEFNHVQFLLPFYF
jgi:hypothetical protein